MANNNHDRTFLVRYFYFPKVSSELFGLFLDLKRFLYIGSDLLVILFVEVKDFFSIMGR